MAFNYSVTYKVEQFESCCYIYEFNESLLNLEELTDADCETLLEFMIKGMRAKVVVIKFKNL
jgi:hypothetical protein